MFSGLTRTVLDLVATYGFVAVFVYMLLESAFILHFVPSELVVPVAASQLVHGPVTFALFVLDTTAGATAGGLLAYYVFGRYGERALERYGWVVHVSRTDLERSQRWFRRWGESSVFWGRMLPVIRALISIPAGLAEMDRRRFVVYTAAGSFVFDTALTYLVYSGSGTQSPLELFLSWTVRLTRVSLAYASSHLPLVAAELALVAVVLAFVWWRRAWIRAHPDAAKMVALRVVLVVGLGAGILLVSSGLLAPTRSFGALTWAWNDPRILLGFGFSPRAVLVGMGAAVVVLALVTFELGRRVSLVDVFHLRGYFQ